jgi:hypothetical protein
MQTIRRSISRKSVASGPLRVGAHYRAIGVQSSEEMLWFWIGSHADYDKMIG